MKFNSMPIVVTPKKRASGQFIVLLSVLSFFSFFLQVTESTAQTESRFTFKAEDQTVAEVLRRVEAQSDYVFIFAGGMRQELSRRVTLEFSGIPIVELLDKVFEGTSLAYGIEGKQVAVTLKPATGDKPATESTGQTVTVSGMVRDRNGLQLPGSTVIIKNTTRGVVTDIHGNFRITVREGETLQFANLGYENLEIRIEPGVTNLDVVMEENVSVMEQIVVIGYGTQTKASSVASITATSGEDLLSMGNVNTVSEALQGRLNGVTAIQSSSKPGGSSAEIFIRGKASWNGSDPLILVDGIDRDMNDIDINEIESISVLKDASATAVYGVRGANGVILVTTKRGRDNSRPVINFTANYGIKQLTMTPYYADYVTSMRMWNEAAVNDLQFENLIPESTIAAWENAFATGNYGPYNDVFPNVDWYDIMLRNVGFSQNYNANISGGSGFMNYFASIGYQHDGDNYKIHKQEDFDPRNYYQRYNYRSNFDFKVTKATTLSINVAGNVGYTNGALDGDYLANIARAPTNLFPVKYSDGEWGDGINSGFNPYANVNTQGQSQTKSFIGWYDFKLDQKLDFITPGLSFSAQLSYNQRTDATSSIRVGSGLGNGSTLGQRSVIRYYRQYDYANPIVEEDGSLTYPLIREIRWPDDNASEDMPITTSYDNLSATNRRLYYEFSLFYKNSFGGHNVTALALMNRQMYDEKGSGSTMEFTQYYEDWVGRVTYNWKERYLSEFNVSYTGSEKFAPNKRFGLFPSLSVGWRISEEPFFRSSPVSDWLRNLKIRYSYGQVGSDQGAYRFNYIQLYESGSNIYFGNDQNIAWGPTYTEGRTANINSTWEVATKQNLGIELDLWNKLTVAVDLFDEKRDKILMTARTTASWFGADLPAVNLGKTKNHGIEVELGWQDRIGSAGFRYFVNFNFATSENRVVFRDDPQDLALHSKDAGKPIGWQSRYLSVANFRTIDDVFNYSQTALGSATPANVIPGDFVYIDFNGDGIIDGNDKVAVTQLNYPLTTLSLNLGWEFKGVRVSALLYAPLGIYRLTPHPYLWDFPQNNVKAQPFTLDRWTPETANTSGVMRPPIHFVRDHNIQDNTFSYRNYSYVRLKNLEVNYTFPKKWLAAVNMTNLSVYVRGTNLFTISGLEDRIDPESGNDVFVYPITKQYTFGVRLSF